MARAAVAALLTLLVLPLTVVATRGLSARYGVPLVAGVQATLFVNALTHVGSAVRQRGYHPGLATAGLILLPFSLYLFHHMLAALYAGAVVERHGHAPAA